MFELHNADMLRCLHILHIVNFLSLDRLCLERTWSSLALLGSLVNELYTFAAQYWKLQHKHRFWKRRRDQLHLSIPQASIIAFGQIMILKIFLDFQIWLAFDKIHHKTEGVYQHTLARFCPWTYVNSFWRKIYKRKKGLVCHVIQL